MPSMAFSQRQQFNALIIEQSVDSSDASKQFRFSRRCIFFIILITLIISLLLFNLDIEVYWSPQIAISENTDLQRLSQNIALSLPKQSQQPSLPKRISTESTTSNLLTNGTEFEQLLSYYSKVSATYYPKSWIHLNEQLFCPIMHSKTLQPHTSISSASERLLKYIYDTQFVENCNDPKHKFLIYDIAVQSGTGIGASFNGGILKFFIRAMMSYRIFLIHGKFEWAANSAHCNGFNGMECYFLPPSNCDPIKVLNNTKDSDIWRGNVPKHCTLGDKGNEKLPLCMERIIVSNEGSSGWYPQNHFIQEWIHSHSDSETNQSLFANFVEFKAILQSFIFRLQPNVRNIIMKKVKNAFVESLKFKQFDPWKSVSFPIRASDKCHKNLLGLNGEMQCWNHTEIYLLLQSIHVLNDHIDTVIFTSEDYDFVSHLIECMQDVNHCDNSTQMKIFENYLDFEWNVIINHDDTKPSIGNAAFMKYQDSKNESFVLWMILVRIWSTMWLSVPFRV